MIKHFRPYKNTERAVDSTGVKENFVKMVQRPAHLRDPPSDEERLTDDDRKHLAFMRLKRYCFLGSFEPVRIHLPLPIVSEIYAKLNQYCQQLEPNKILSILRTASKSRLFRRDEVTLLHVTYLLGDTQIKYKTIVREEFVNLIKTDVELFLFCKYATAVHKKILKRPIFCKTIKKAITAWYVSKSSQELAEMFRTNRGRNGFTHGALLRICRISDHVLGTKYIYESFSNRCTTLLAQREKTLPPPPASKLVKQKEAIASNIVVVPTTSSSTTTKIEGETDAAATAQQKTKEHQTMISVPPKECNAENIRSQILAISEVRTAVNAEEAIPLIEKFQLRFEHLPYHLLEYPAVLNKVIPSMSCEQLLECFHAPKIRAHFAKQEVLKVCRRRFQKQDALKGEDIDPIMCLLNLDNLKVDDPIKQTNNKKTNRGQIVQFSKVLFRFSFNDTKPLNLNIHITINMQDFYMKKTLKNTNTTGYNYAATALAFTFFKAEKVCDVFRWCENEMRLQPVEFKKDFQYADAFNETKKFKNFKNKQRLWLPIVEALKQKDTKKYDLFICIVPAATRGNKKNCSEYLADYLAKYRRACENKARLIIVDLCRYRKSMRYAKTSCENILEVCGLDVYTVSLIRNFALGNFD